MYSLEFKVGRCECRLSQGWCHHAHRGLVGAVKLADNVRHVRYQGQDYAFHVGTLRSFLGHISHRTWLRGWRVLVHEERIALRAWGDGFDQRLSLEVIDFKSNWDAGPARP